MKIIKRLKQLIRPPMKNRPILLTFTGGMGAQIISAAIYFSIKNSGRAVYADFSYFDTPEKIAAEGNLGECSHWSWQLNEFGLFMESFETLPHSNPQDFDVVHDDEARKSELSLQALSKPEIQRLFKIPQGVDDILGNGEDNYICLHVRRGDYTNVASHLITQEEFLSVAKKFEGLVSRVVILSDSPIEADFRDAIESIFKIAHFLDNVDAYIAHRIMRNARVIVCSNSQFSLTAALLNPSALVIVPIQWFSGSHRRLEAPLNSVCSFQITR